MEGLEGEDDETSTTTSRSRFLLNMAPAARFTHMILAHDCESGRLLSFLSARSTRWLLYSSGNFSHIISKRRVELFQLVSGSNVGCFVRLLHFVACPASDSRYCSTWGAAVTKQLWTASIGSGERWYWSGWSIFSVLPTELTCMHRWRPPLQNAAISGRRLSAKDRIT